uniref:Uncharacterized protein n=1 Tax=Caenorhabditis japonica TaxID=281687 RepID=A0A8R1IQ11_CAEJA
MQRTINTPSGSRSRISQKNDTADREDDDEEEEEVEEESPSVKRERRRAAHAASAAIGHHLNETREGDTQSDESADSSEEKERAKERRRRREEEKEREDEEEEEDDDVSEPFTSKASTSNGTLNNVAKSEKQKMKEKKAQEKEEMRRRKEVEKERKRAEREQARQAREAEGMEKRQEKNKVKEKEKFYKSAIISAAQRDRKFWSKPAVHRSCTYSFRTKKTLEMRKKRKKRKWGAAPGRKRRISVRNMRLFRDWALLTTSLHLRDFTKYNFPWNRISQDRMTAFMRSKLFLKALNNPNLFAMALRGLENEKMLKFVVIYEDVNRIRRLLPKLGLPDEV